MENKYIYIVLVKALTGLGEISRLISKYEYSHIAVCFDNEFNDFVTFSRRKHYSPFDAGFMHEKREHYAFGENKRVKIKVFKVPVSDIALQNIEEYVEKIENDKDYIFNIYSMITMPIIHGFEIYKAHNCMSFVGKVLSLSGAIKMDKPFYKYNILDMDEMLGEYFYKEGYLKKKSEDAQYMQKDSIAQNIKNFITLNAKLIKRMTQQLSCHM